jgi:hypothetical protein
MKHPFYAVGLDQIERPVDRGTGVSQPRACFILGRAGFPDAAAHNMQVTEEPTYDVRFHSEELWPGASDEAFIHVGLFQSYLEKIG